MSNAGMISFILIAANIMVSYRGMTDPVFYDRYAFDVDRILLGREYKRLITSGFLHVSWSHLVFNMLSLYFFSANLAFLLGTGYFLLVYFASLVGGNLFSLFVHRNEGSFRFRRSTIVRSSGASSASSRADNVAPDGSRTIHLRIDATQSLASTLSPSWNHWFSRNVMTQRLPSSSTT